MLVMFSWAPPHVIFVPFDHENADGQKHLSIRMICMLNTQLSLQDSKMLKEILLVPICIQA